MRELNTQELITVSGAGKTGAAKPNPIAIIKGLLAAKGITIALDKVAHTVTVTTPKGTKTFTLPTPPTAPTAPVEEVPVEETVDA
jgi:hypothetical protein